METLIKTLFFKTMIEIIYEGALSDDKKLQNLWDDFIIQIVNVCDNINGKALLRLLNYTRLKLVALQEESKDSIKKNCREIYQARNSLYRY